MWKKFKKIVILSLILALMGTLLGFVPLVQAGTLTNASDTLSRLKVSVSADHYVQFTTATAATLSYYQISFPDEFDLSGAVSPTLEIRVGGVDESANGDWTFSNTAGNKYARWTYTTPTAVGANVAIELWFESVVNPSTAGSYTLTFATNDGTSDVDTTTVVVTILSDEQVAVGATVPQSISFSISDLAIGFGTWSATEIRYATGDETGSTTEPAAGQPTQLTASTNAGNGLTITIKSQGDGTSAGLYKSVSPTKLISAVASSSVAAGSEGYGVYGKNASLLTIDEGFDNDGVSDLAVSTSAQTFVSTTTPVSNGTVDAVPIAAIATDTPAGSYSDALTFVCTGNF
jgi:hypothetical protein